MQAREVDLTPEYREERDRLKDRLTSDLVPKEKNGECLLYCFHIRCTLLSSIIGRPITGPELASLLEVLVSAANEGSLAEVHVGGLGVCVCAHVRTCICVISVC